MHAGLAERRLDYSALSVNVNMSSAANIVMLRTTNVTSTTNNNTRRNSPRKIHL